MSSERFKQVADLFLRAQAIAPDERDQWLESQVEGDVDLANQVKLMLDAATDDATFVVPPLHEQSMDIGNIGSGTGSTSGTTSQQHTQAPDVVGHYRILEQIGEGGFGAVFLAEQREPVRRRVALKIMKRGMDSERFVARFEAERQAVALMTHPNIAGIHDAGTTDDGRPYYTMELVQGLPITEHCNNAQLAVEERLRLFIPVCQAIQHAHQKGLIHRDIKPSNVLVAKQDNLIVPKVIDFGVAKAIGADLTDKTIYTEYDQLIGTPEYMSPEQAEQSGSLVDTRSDVYSLGVLLYELLAGVTPHDSAELRRGGLSEMRRIIRSATPSRPSAKLTAIREKAKQIAHDRSTDIPTLQDQLSRDLDWIVMKCLEHEMERRYTTVRDLELDIQRYLNNEPIEARPPSIIYRLAKYTQRHRAVATSMLILFMTILVGLTGLIYHSLEVTRERDLALIAIAEADEARSLAEAARREAEASRLTSEAVTEILTSMMEGVAPGIARGRDTSLLLDLVQNAYDNAETTLAEQPEARARIEQTFGTALNRLGRSEDAVALLEKSVATFTETLGPESPERLRSMLELSLTCYRLERIDCAREWSEEALDVALNFQPPIPETLIAVVRFAQVLHEEAKFDELEQFLVKYRRTLTSKFDPLDSDMIALTSMMATTHLELGRPTEATRLFDDALERLEISQGPDHPQTIRAMGNAARAHAFIANYDQAERLAKRAVEQSTQVLGPEHPDTLTITGTLANAIRDQGRLDEALQLYESLIERRTRVYGAKSAQRMITVNNMASAFYHDEQYDKAEPLFREVIDVWTDLRGANHPHTLIARSNLADTLNGLERLDEAEQIQAGVVEGMIQSLPNDHWWIGGALSKHGAMLISMGRDDAGENAMLEAYRILVATPGEGERRAGTVASRLAAFYHARNRVEEAKEWETKARNLPQSETGIEP
ncbi:MAG: tetratricopeptide repeat protein [Phycisphaerae bacterium]